MVLPRRFILFLTQTFNWIAAGAVVVMMLLTSSDVVLRLFRHPLPGAYEIVGLLGAIIISFSLAYTSVEKGHIAVEFLVQRFSRGVQACFSVFNDLFSTALFAVIAWQTFAYAGDLKRTGEVSLTVQAPVYPFVYGVAIGSGLLCVVLMLDLLTSLHEIGKK
ncbi:MAG: TRAP transporter small permease [Deltaproteobacteria bacterium]|nr:TRAP transporter small permease [Deltaproteobacteria bacterium]